MTIDECWYSRDAEAGQPPYCRRLSGLPVAQQWTLTIDLTIAYAEGRAGWRHAAINTTAERYWYWQHDLSPSGCWIIPFLIDQRVQALVSAARGTAMRQNKGGYRLEDVVRILRQWKRTRQWQRHASDIFPQIAASPKRRPQNEPRAGRAKQKQKNANKASRKV